MFCTLTEPFQNCFSEFVIWLAHCADQVLSSLFRFRKICNLVKSIIDVFYEPLSIFPRIISPLALSSLMRFLSTSSNFEKEIGKFSYSCGVGIDGHVFEYADFDFEVTSSISVTWNVHSRYYFAY